MAIPQQRRQRRKYPRTKVVFAILIVPIIVAVSVWIQLSQGSWPAILSVVFVGGALIISLLQWLFPISPNSTESHPLERENASSYITSSIKAENAASRHSAPITTSPILTDVSDSNVAQRPHAVKVKYNHIAAPPGNVFEQVEVLTEIQKCLIDRDIRGIFLWGGRGCGKSLIAKKIAESCMVEDGPMGKRFTHIVWLTFRKEELTTTGIAKPYNFHQSKHEIYAEILEVHEQPYRGNKDPLKGIQEVLRNAPTLVILDSFEFFLEEEKELDSDFAALLSEVAVGSFFLLTSWRDSPEIRRYTYRVIEVRAFDATKAKEYFIYLCKEKSILLSSRQWSEEVYEEIFKATAGIPLALELVSNYIHSISDIKAVLDDIKPGSHDLWEYIYERALQQLNRNELRLLVMMILFKSLLDKRKLQSVIGYDKQSYEKALTQLHHYGLWTMVNDNFYLHDTLREYVMNRKKNSTLITEVQQDFIEWEVGIAKEYEEWEVYSEKANLFADDLNNLIDALELLLVKYTVKKENTLCAFGTTVAHYLHISGRWPESEKFLNAIFEKMSGDVNKIKVQILLGRHYAHQEEFDVAKEYLDPAMRKAEEIGDETLQAEVYLRLGQTYLRRDPDQALEFLEKAQDKAARRKNYDSLRTRISALSYMAEVQLLKGKSNEALELLDKADKDMSGLQWDRVLAHHASLKADAYLSINDKVKARKYYNESKSLSENGADGRLLAWNYLGLAELDRNLDYARKAVELFETVGLKSQIKRAQDIIDELIDA